MQGKTIVGQIIQRAPADEVAVYRLFRADRVLLYVGISKDPMNRWREHVHTQWWPDVTEYCLTWYSTRAEARKAEVEIMWGESPLHNIHSAPRHSSHWLSALNSPEALKSRRNRARAKAD